MSTQSSEHPVASWRDEIRQSTSARTVALVLATLLLACGFIYSYIGAFHDPSPHAITMQVAAKQSQASSQERTQLVDQTVGRLESLEGHPIDASAAASPADVRRDVTNGSVSSGLILDPDGKKDVLYVASGGGTSVTSAVEQVVDGASQSQKRSYTVQDVVPLAEGDAKGLTGFYLAVGWVVGGYLVASLLAVAEGSRPVTRRHALLRLGLFVPYSIALGFGGAAIAGPLLDAWEAPLLPLGLVGTATVLCVAAASAGLQAMLGTFGIGAAVLLFVVLGNPSAGGPYQADLLPTFWSNIGPFIPTGAATVLIRDIVYFDSDGTGWQLAVLAAYLVVGAVMTAVMARSYEGHHAAPEQDQNVQA